MKHLGRIPLESKLTPTEQEVFLLFAEYCEKREPFTLQEIAHRRGSTREAVRQIAVNLRHAGLIAKKPDSYKRWKITKLGERLKAAIQNEKRPVRN